MKRPLHVLLTAPRGFCAGVDRAIRIVEDSLAKWGRPVYVRHEIVHNEHVVSRLEDAGAVFVDTLDDCPDDRPVVFSAHGVPQAVPDAARARGMLYIDATCPLVSKVHIETRRHYQQGRDIVLVGHAGHPEVVGTMGQLPAGAVTLVETLEDVARLNPVDDGNLAFVTQTTLSIDDTAQIIAALRKRFPRIVAPHKEDICYATTNRQEAVKALAWRADLFLVIGAETSSNSKRLVEVSKRAGAGDARLVSSVECVDWKWFENVHTLGLTAGASAPEYLVGGLLAACRARFDMTVEEIEMAKEDVNFKLPGILERTQECSGIR